MTDLAAIFHWSLPDMQAMTIDDLIFWRERAGTWWNEVHAKKE